MDMKNPYAVGSILHCQMCGWTGEEEQHPDWKTYQREHLYQ